LAVVGGFPFAFDAGAVGGETAGVSLTEAGMVAQQRPRSVLEAGLVDALYSTRVVVVLVDAIAVARWSDDRDPVGRRGMWMIGASPQLTELARAYYQRAPERTIRALAAVLEKLADRGLLHVEDPHLAASQFAFLVVGQVLDKSLFCGDRPFSQRELQAHAKAGVRTFLRAYGPARTRSV
jgi:hypothetical protein